MNGSRGINQHRGRRGGGHHHGRGCEHGGGFGRKMHEERRRGRGDDPAPSRGGRHGRRGGGRIFDHGALRLVLLSQIAEAPGHGYELMKRIETRLAGAYSPSPGVLYPTLSLLEDQGLIAAEATGGRKQFSLTDNGRAWIAANADDMARVEIKMKALAGQSHRPVPVRDGIEALRNAVHARLHGETPLTDDQITAIAAILNRAAEEVTSA